MRVAIVAFSAILFGMIRLSLPAGRIQSGKRIRLGVSTSEGAYYPALQSAVSDAGRTYSVAVPRDVPVRLFLDADVSVTHTASQAVMNRQQSFPRLLPPT